MRTLVVQKVPEVWTAWRVQSLMGPDITQVVHVKPGEWVVCYDTPRDAEWIMEQREGSWKWKLTMEGPSLFGTNQGFP